MKNNRFIKYYRVYKNETEVTEISVNDFKRVTLGGFKRGLPTGGHPVNPYAIHQFHYSLPPDEAMFYGYLDRAHAMEKAKTGALVYIGVMIQEVEKSIQKLVQYRTDHYEDLNINLLDEHIRKFRKVMHMK